MADSEHMTTEGKPTLSKGQLILRWIAWVILIIWAAFWIYFGVGSGIAEISSLGFMALIMHLIMPVAILIILYISWRWPAIGGILLLLGVGFAWFAFNLNDPKRIIVALVLALPGAVAGVLFVIIGLIPRNGRSAEV